MYIKKLLGILIKEYFYIKKYKILHTFKYNIHELIFDDEKYCNEKIFLRHGMEWNVTT